MTDKARCPSCLTTTGAPKVAYPDKAAATDGMNGLAKAFGSDRLGVFPCPKGHGWHVGHKPGTLTKDLKRLRRQSSAVRASLRASRNRKRR